MTDVPFTMDALTRRSEALLSGYESAVCLTSAAPLDDARAHLKIVTSAVETLWATCTRDPASLLAVTYAVDDFRALFEEGRFLFACVCARRVVAAFETLSLVFEAQCKAFEQHSGASS